MDIFIYNFDYIRLRWDQLEQLNYPILTGRFASSKLVNDLSELFLLLGIKNSVQLNRSNERYNKTYLISAVTISGYKRLSKYLKLIGFNNPKNIRKLKNGPNGI